MSRAGLYKALSEDGNPTLATVMRITRALDAVADYGVAAPGAALWSCFPWVEAQQARKASGRDSDLTDQDSPFRDEAIEAVLLRAAERAYDPDRDFPRRSMSR